MEERGGFDESYVVLFTRAYRVAKGVLHEVEAARDVAAEATARAYAAWSRISAFAPAWIGRVALNLAVDRLRRRTVVNSLPPADLGPESSLERLWVLRALRRLPERQRQALALRYLLDMDEADAAEFLGVAPETLRTHVKRGLRRMRSDLGEDRASAEEDHVARR